MADIHLSCISYVHGQWRPIGELGEPGCDDERLTQDGLGGYREATMSSFELACEVGTQTLAVAGVVPDLVLYATETPDQGEEAFSTNARLAMALGAPGAVVVNVAGHGCGNLGLLVQLADRLLGAGSALLVTADQARGRARMMGGPLSVLSDGAAAVWRPAIRPRPGRRCGFAASRYAPTRGAAPRT